MAPAPTLDELATLTGTKEYDPFVKAAMRDFCFSISLHAGRERTWFGVYTLTINRNVAFNFFDRDISGDDAIERFPVVRSERTETVDIRVRPEPDDPSADYDVPVFNLERKEFDAAIRSLHDIDERLAGLRTIPDVCFDNEPVIQLARQKLLVHPTVKAERAADWPDLLT